MIDDTPAAAAQRQLDAYNAHDLDAFVACYHPDVEVRDFPAGTLRVAGREALRARYADVLARPGLRADVVRRITHGAVVVDEERVVGLREGVVAAVAIYEVEGALIRRVWFVRERE
jgi:hypothetical protein